jgi:hypothetical protein
MVISRIVCGDLKDGQCESAQSRNPRNNLKLPIGGSPKPLGILIQNFGQMMSTIGKIRPKSFDL